MAVFKIRKISERESDKYHYYLIFKIGMNFKKEINIETGKKEIKFYTVGFTYQI